VKKFFARDALLPSGWARDVCITVDDGDITSVEAGSSGGEALHGPVLPGMANLHSHAFQRGMAGLAEVRGAPDDDFWTWRELMYRFVERVTPAQAKAIALHLYIEMLKNGYTAVAEFNYLNDPADMLEQHLDAARAAGIAFTALPSLYRWSGFGQQPLKPRQKRFDSDVRHIIDAFQSVPRTRDERAGVAPHSLRAVDPGALRELVAEAGDAPIHIHAAEQTKEVEDCRLALGQRPVEWLLANFRVDERWCLVHATHMVPDETRALAKTGAVAGLCPTTEGNLGDGVFPLLEFRAAGGRYGIGGDSHVSRDPAEELRLLEYVQRLVARKRNLVVGDRSQAVGTTLWLEAAAGGAQAMGRAMGAIAPGKRADLVVLDTDQRGDAAANSLVFAGTPGLVRDVMVAGDWVVRERRHGQEAEAASRYAETVKALVA